MMMAWVRELQVLRRVNWLCFPSFYSNIYGLIRIPIKWAGPNSGTRYALFKSHETTRNCFFLSHYASLLEGNTLGDFKLVGVGPRLKLRKNHLPQCNTITKSTAESFKHQVCASYHST